MEIESLHRPSSSAMPLSIHPDGKRIAFIKGQPRQTNLWVMDNLQSKFKANK